MTDLDTRGLDPATIEAVWSETHAAIRVGKLSILLDEADTARALWIAAKDAARLLDNHERETP